jgi:orotidine-5'-phosphate decarboxylase
MSKKAVQPFFEKLQALNAKRGTALCVGIDPPVEGLPPFFKKQQKANPQSFLLKFSKAVIDAAKKRVSIVKLQSAYYEMHGPKGVAVLAESIAYAKKQGLLTLLDAKRGDIADTMRGYTEMAFGQMGADAMTFSPYLGIGVMKPMLPWFAKGKGAYIVWVSSNPEATDLQNIAADYVLNSACEWAAQNHLQGSLGLVVGATKLQLLNSQKN